MSPCPHCRALAQAERSASLRWRCAVCGGPLVPSDGSFPRAHEELPSLVRAGRTAAMAFGWAAAGVTAAGGALVCLTLALLLGRLAMLGAAAALGTLATAGLALALGCALRSRSRRAEVRTHLDEAWSSVARDLLRARGADVTAADLARALPIDERDAEALLSAMSARGGVRVAVSDDAQLSYGLDPDPETTSAPGGQGERRSP